MGGTPFVAAISAWSSESERSEGAALMGVRSVFTGRRRPTLLWATGLWSYSQTPTDTPVADISPQTEADMNRNQVKGTAKDVAGKVQQKVGEVTGSASQQVKGAGKQIEGKIQKRVGDVEEAAKDAEESRVRKASSQRPDRRDPLSSRATRCGTTRAALRGGFPSGRI